MVQLGPILVALALLPLIALLYASSRAIGVSMAEYSMGATHGCQRWTSGSAA
jgi:hypothetical protein